ncbi:MAG TPA: aldo/keto reductase [Gaiellaceae bacterium]|nr:aldo/keto reductase [Gaiellaceae bacterium]
MQLRQLGRTGLEVSRVALGCGNFGGIGSAPAFFGAGESDEEALAIMDAAWELGVTLFDTADAYGGGRSERAVGRWMRERGRRPLVATKVFHSVAGDPRDQGLGRERILRQIEGSLQRLGVERVDLYLIHQPDPRTPVAETLGALDELVRAGTVGAVGASNVDAAQLREALAVSEERGFVRFEWVQNPYNLLERADEEELLPLCEEQGLGYTPFGPLAGGWLTGKYRRGEPYPAGSRMTLRPEPYADLEDERTYAGLEALAGAARERGVATAALALAWVLGHPLVTAAVVGPRRPEHLDVARAALGIELSGEERRELGALFA